MICVCVVVCLGNLLCSWTAGSNSLAAVDNRVVPSLVWGRALSPLCSFACTVVALSIWSCVYPDGVVRFSIIVVHTLTPSSRRGAMYFNSICGYLRGWHWFRRCLV